MTGIILLIQIESADSTRVREALTHSTDSAFVVESVQRCSDGLQRLVTERGPMPNRISAILLDLFLPDSIGIETFDRVARAAPHVPILVLCAEQDEAIGRLAVQHGAQDFLLKSRVDGYTLPKILHNMLERAAAAAILFKEMQRAQVTLDSIGDAVVCTDNAGRVTYLNRSAERITGCTRQESEGLPLEELFGLINADSGGPVENPLIRAIRENTVVGLTPNCELIRRDRVSIPIEDSASPIHDQHGQIIGAVMVFHDVTAARTLALKMAYQAQHDSLTDLPNRAVLKDRLVQAMGLARRSEKKVALLFIDLDRFKNINDSLGHAIGDRLLQSVAQRLIGCIRGTDTVSRQGGDEFVILMSEISQSRDAAVCADKIIEAMTAPQLVEAHALHVTASIGIAVYPDDGDDPDTLMKKADLAMYVAKDRGRDSYQCFIPEMDGLSIERQSVENDLRHAIDRGEITLHYQPIVDLETRSILGAEALIRWQHPLRGLVPASHFIPIAEERGLIGAIGAWVLRQACLQLQRWRVAGLQPIRMFINVSAASLREKAFLSDVRATLSDAALVPNDLELELTETFLMQDPDNTATVLRDLARLGVGIALDDFGTGYSSLSHLRRFPIGTLKVDRSFVQAAITEADDAEIVVAVVGLGRSLKLQVVAEGVETVAQLSFLLELGCPAAQGHYFSPAVSADDFARLLEHGSLDAKWPDVDDATKEIRQVGGAGASEGRLPSTMHRRRSV